MSFSIDFVAKNKSVAISHVQKAYAPGSVKAFLECALNNLEHNTPVKVKAVGHLHETAGDYATSTATIEVFPFPLLSE